MILFHRVVQQIYIFFLEFHLQIAQDDPGQIIHFHIKIHLVLHSHLHNFHLHFNSRSWNRLLLACFNGFYRRICYNFGLVTGLLTRGRAGCPCCCSGGLRNRRRCPRTCSCASLRSTVASDPLSPPRTARIAFSDSTPSPASSPAPAAPFRCLFPPFRPSLSHQTTPLLLSPVKMNSGSLIQSLSSSTHSIYWLTISLLRVTFLHFWTSFKCLAPFHCLL